VPELRIFGRLSNGEKEIMDQLNQHVELSVKAAEQLGTFVDEVLSEDWDGAREIYKKIDELESSADAVHKRVVEKLSSGVFFAGIGVDLINLAENIDGIADSAKDAARVLIYRKPEISMLASIRKLLQDYLVVCIKSAHAIQRAVKAIGESREDVLSNTRETEQYEEAADELKDELIERIYGLNLNVLSTLQLKDFVLLADDIGDYSEDAGDIMYILMSKGYA
jgi:predicted phosphate transport protein (TIGR00153 family)